MKTYKGSDGIAPYINVGSICRNRGLVLRSGRLLPAKGPTSAGYRVGHKVVLDAVSKIKIIFLAGNQIRIIQTVIGHYSD
jgi:hypothetical protein